jgi:hypothetical protein
LEKEKYADFIALGGNSLRNIKALSEIGMVLKKGKEIFGTPQMLT